MEFFNKSKIITRGQLDTGPLGVGVVGDDGGVVAGSPGHLAAVSVLLLQVANNGSLRHGTHGHHVADGEVGALAAVHELACVHALNGDEKLLADLVPGEHKRFGLLVSSTSATRFIIHKT